MQMIKRFGLFIATNLLVIVTIGIVWSILSSYFGIGNLANNGNLLIYCLVWGMVGSFISLFMSKWMAKMSYGVKIVEPNVADPDLQYLVRKVHEFARAANLPKMPEVGYYESEDLNAFATGPSKSNSLVAVSTGLLNRMTKEEVDGVLAHEVAHIANGDMVTMTLIQGVVNAFVLFFSKIVARVVASNVDEKYATIVRFGVEIAAYVVFAGLGAIIVNTFSRAREFRADSGGAKLASRQSMIAALEKLRRAYDMPIHEDEHQATATLMISHRQKGKITALFMTHPPLEVRIEALKKATNF